MLCQSSPKEEKNATKKGWKKNSTKKHRQSLKGQSVRREVPGERRNGKRVGYNFWAKQHQKKKKQQAR